LANLYKPEIPGGVLYAPIEISATGTLVFGVAGKSIVVLSAWMVASNQVNAKFQTSTGPVDLTGPADCAQYGGFVLNFNASGWFATAVGDSLILNLSSGIAVGGSLSYVLV
jgi:hypothetical protein